LDPSAKPTVSLNKGWKTAKLVVDIKNHAEGPVHCWLSWNG
jgi:hypothetical protein